MTTGIQYVIAAHGVIVAAALLYAAVAAARAGRLRREAELLSRIAGGEARR